MMRARRNPARQKEPNRKLERPVELGFLYVNFQFLVAS